MRLFLFSLLAATSCIGQTSFNFTINGTLKNYPEGKYIYLHHKWNEKTFTDSLKTKAGIFSYKGKSPESNMYWLTNTNDPNSKGSLLFFVDAGKTTITGNNDSLAFARVEAGQTQKDYTDYMNLMNSFGSRQQQLNTAYQEAQRRGDQNTMSAKVQEYQVLEVEVKNNLKNFIKTHSKSAISGYAIYFNYQNPNISMQELEEVVGYLDKSSLNTKYGKLAQDRLAQLRGTTIGYPAVNFSQNDANGKAVNLTDFKGKYVLVDFWASWCGPCRAENPNVVNSYIKYKDKGFTVLGVSLDQNKEKWLKAVEADKLAWTQVSDLQGWSNSAAKLYGITSIPQNLLLDKEGKILAKNLRGAELEQKLAEIFK